MGAGRRVSMPCALLARREQAGQIGSRGGRIGRDDRRGVGRHPKLETVFASPLIRHEEKSALLDRVFQPRMSRLLLNFLKVVSRHGRLDCLRAIRHAGPQDLRRVAGHVRVRMTTADAVGPEHAEKITAALAARWAAADPGNGCRSRAGRRGRPPHRRYRLRRFRRQPVATNTPADDR